AYVLDGTSRQFEVEWDEEENKIVLTTGQGYTAVGNELNKEIGSGARTAIQTDSEVYLDGKAIFLTAYKIDGNNYFKLRDLGANIDFGVDWNAGAKTIEISSGKGYEPDGEPVIGMHTSVYDDETAQMLIDSLPALSQQGVNLVIAEVGYDYQYTSHPELAAEYGLSFEYARAIAEAAKETGIKLVPEFPCLGHQSWAEDTGALLTVYPEFDETPGKYPNNEGIYCRSWCPLNEEVNPIVFDLMDELMEAFQADAIHVGLDEVFIIGDEDCPRCHGKDPGDLFAKQVNDLYQHFVVEEGVGMYMWSDRLLDGEAVGDVYSEWDASYNGTYTAIDQIPKDIVMCDWHYDNLEAYPSINYFADKGFSVLTASYNDTEAAENFIQATMEARKTNANVQGHLYTTWEDIENKELPDWEPMIRTIELLKEK
ncbi:MAG: family 20 glycosylhydrolase, partial [Clostridia bacterium]|nr:family 20 glycosylhydrolase [Clostridia bacterium]